MTGLLEIVRKAALLTILVYHFGYDKVLVRRLYITSVIRLCIYSTYCLTHMWEEAEKMKSPAAEHVLVRKYTH